MNAVRSGYFTGKKVLVAGGTGLIGIPLVHGLLAQGAAVRVASLDDPSRCPAGADFIRADLMEPGACREVCRSMDFVFNLLGVKGSPKVTLTRPASFLAPTILLAMNLLEAARREAVPGYLYASSIAVYPPREVMREDDAWEAYPSQNDWFGGWGKRMGELHVEAVRREFGWDRLAVVRPANVYGPFDNFSLDNAMVVPSLIRRAVEGERPLRVWGDGSPVRDFIHASDVARCMLLVAEAMPQHPVNIGSGRGVSIRELAEVVAGCVTPRLEVEWDPSKPSGDAMRVLDVSRARSLGFEPRISLEEGVRETMAWFREHRQAETRRHDIFA